MFAACGGVVILTTMYHSCRLRPILTDFNYKDASMSLLVITVSGAIIIMHTLLKLDIGNQSIQ